MVCTENWCRKQARHDSPWCPYHSDVHQIEDAMRSAEREEKRNREILYSQVCLACAHRGDVRMTPNQRNALVGSGWLRCPECRSAAIECSPADAGSITSPMNGVHRQTRSRNHSVRLAG